MKGFFADSGARLRRIWMRRAVRGIHYTSNYAKLNTIYALKDPWHMNSAIETYRFAETNLLIRENFGLPGSILEIGCGEGHQSVHLRSICKELTGVDVSLRAVCRARERCHGTDFIVDDIFSKDIDTRAPFDLIVACEVLYYMRDVAAAIRRMNELGSACFITYLDRMHDLDPLVLSLPGITTKVLEFEQVRWRAAWWRQSRVLAAKPEAR